MSFVVDAKRQGPVFLKASLEHEQKVRIWVQRFLRSLNVRENTPQMLLGDHVLKPVLDARDTRGKFGVWILSDIFHQRVSTNSYDDRTQRHQTLEMQVLNVLCLPPRCDKCKWALAHLTGR